MHVADAPLWTTVLFFDFPAKAKGGENIDAQLIQKLETALAKAFAELFTGF